AAGDPPLPPRPGAQPRAPPLRRPRPRRGPAPPAAAHTRVSRRPQTTAPAGPHDTLIPARPRRPRCCPPSARASPRCPAHRPPPTPPRPAPPHHNPPAPRSPRYRHSRPARPLPAPCGNLRERFLVHEGGFGHRQREREAGTLDTATAEWTADEERAGRRSGGRRLRTVGAALLFTGVSAVVGCRAADTDGPTPVTQLLAFLPWLLVPTGAGLLFALLARWRTGLVCGVVLLGLLAWFIEPYGKSTEPAGRPVASLRVLTSNVEFGRGTGPLIGAVRREKPDLVFVQEC